MLRFQLGYLNSIALSVTKNISVIIFRFRCVPFHWVCLKYFIKRKRVLFNRKCKKVLFFVTGNTGIIAVLTGKFIWVWNFFRRLLIGLERSFMNVNLFKALISTTMIVVFKPTARKPCTFNWLFYLVATPVGGRPRGQWLIAQGATNH